MAKSPTKAESAVIPIKPDARATAAKPDGTAAAAEEGKPKKKKRLKWIIIITTVVLLLAAAGAGVWFFMAEEPSGSSPAAPPPAPEKPAIFVPLDPFTVNLQQENGDQYLQTALVVKVTHNPAAEAIKQQMPEIRYRLILVLSNKRPSEIASVAGKQALIAEITAEVKKLVAPALRDDVTAVFFTTFVVQ
ncbi:MAG TPA: flagellar basal body-associated protein FliL [Burkholderiales bacterium]|nr:flagellar basal body-associated protein FliL [Burkholderiales bacterium]